MGVRKSLDCEHSLIMEVLNSILESERSEFVGEITMRKCIRCLCEMRENYDVKVEGSAYGLKITEQGIFKDNLGKVHAAACPKCGYLEFYLKDTAKLNN